MSDPYRDRGPLLGWQETRLAMARLRAAREKAGIQAKQLSLTAGWYPQRVSVLENMRQRVRVHEVRTLARLLDTTVDDLLPREVPR